jgi:hypothetical protein
MLLNYSRLNLRQEPLTMDNHTSIARIIAALKAVGVILARLLRAEPPQPLPDEKEQEYLDRQW